MGMNEMMTMTMTATTKQLIFTLLLLYWHIWLRCFTYINRSNTPKTLWGRHDYYPHLQTVKLRDRWRNLLEVISLEWTGINEMEKKEKRIPNGRSNRYKILPDRGILEASGLLFFRHRHICGKGDLYPLSPLSLSRYFKKYLLSSLVTVHSLPEFDPTPSIQLSDDLLVAGKRGHFNKHFFLLQK